MIRWRTTRVAGVLQLFSSFYYEASWKTYRMEQNQEKHRLYLYITAVILAAEARCVEGARWCRGAMV